jgi:hypothetical protein
MFPKIAPGQKFSLNFTESRHRIVPSFLENSLYLFLYMYKCLYQFPMMYKQILIHHCKICVILFLGAQDVTKIDLILLKKGNKMTDIELSLKISLFSRGSGTRTSNTQQHHDTTILRPTYPHFLASSCRVRWWGQTIIAVHHC